MAKIFVNGEWYEEVASASMYEAEYEKVLRRHATDIFPAYHLVPFQCLVESEYGAVRPDLALIRRDYADWWVVEVEMAHHSLDGHVLPQVRRMAAATYAEPEARFLCKQMPGLDEQRVNDMMKGLQPRVLVIVNSPHPEWVRTLRRYDAMLAVFEIFRSENGRYVFRLNGERPTAFMEILTECFLDPSIPRFLRVTSPGSLPKEEDGVYRFEFEGRLTEWTRIDAQDTVWLSPNAANPLSLKCRYELVRNGDDSLVLRTKEQPKGRKANGS